mgnify:CR=1 FL=1
MYKKIKASTVWHHILYKTPPQSGAGFVKTNKNPSIIICKKKQTPVLTPSQLLHSILVFMDYFEGLELLKAAIDIHTVIIVTEVSDKKICDADGW